METRWEVHLAAAGLTTLLIGAIVLFWSYPQLLVYVLLAVVAALSYGALYLILAARMDPRRLPTITRTAPPLQEEEPAVSTRTERAVTPPEKLEPTRKEQAAARQTKTTAKKATKKKRARKTSGDESETDA